MDKPHDENNDLDKKTTSDSRYQGLSPAVMADDSFWDDFTTSTSNEPLKEVGEQLGNPMDWAEEASRSLRAEPMCFEEFDGGLEASQSLNPCLAINQSKTHSMHLSLSFRYPKTKWKRLARQL